MRNNLSTKEFTNLLQKNGFRYQGTKGSHMKFTRGRDMQIVAVHSKSINPMIVRTAIKKYDLKS